MGSPLVPVLANLFLWGIMKNYGWKIFNALKFYFIVGMFHLEHDALIFLDYIN